MGNGTVSFSGGMGVGILARDKLASKPVASVHSHPGVFAKSLHVTISEFARRIALDMPLVKNSCCAERNLGHRRTYEPTACGKRHRRDTTQVAQETALKTTR